MADETAAPRSRRALLTAAAGAAGALAASAVLPLTAVAAAGDPVLQENDNATADTTSITNSTDGSTAFAGSQTGTTADPVNGVGFGYGVQGTSVTGAGLFGWSIASPEDSTWPSFTPDIATFTGVFGWAPPDPDNAYGAGVWGASDDTGVVGTGGIGVLGSGGPGGVGVQAWGASPTDVGLDVQGKVKFSRSGRVTLASGKSSIKVTLAGTSSGSRVFAVLHSNRTGRWIQSVVPTTGSFTIYLNGTVSSSTYIAWFVLN